ncbi:MAG: TIGR04283 family arsenosugar biosynthesis glycosyltransferase [Desulfobacterales bacterium]|nr:TIGR04283 family arsenosugar biosynthesis glycosyltransferase [Desulfobacterales bacterium]
MTVTPPERTPERISVIIPTLDEEKTIAPLLGDLQQARRAEIIVVDGGSRDRTVVRAQQMGAHVIRTPPGRARQMNRGAAEARGRLLFFVHADSRLPTGFDDLLRRTLGTRGVAAAAFRLRIDAPGGGLRFVEFWANIRSRLLQMPYGDQGLGLPAALFESVGGFPALPIMEDFELVRRLRARGRIAILPAAVRTSPRRWLNVGVGRTTLINQAIVSAYLAGVPPRKLARFYRRSRGIG